MRYASTRKTTSKGAEHTTHYEDLNDSTRKHENTMVVEPTIGLDMLLVATSIMED
jgi:hypothetical protein